MIKKLVISYSDDDRDVAFRILEDLLKANYDVWIDKKNIRGKPLWTQAVLDAIDDAEGVVLVWSLAAEKSKVVPEEIRIARVFRKPIFPLLAHPGDKIPSLPNEIRALQVIDEGNFDSNIAELKARLSDPIRSNIRYSELAQNGYIPKPPNPYFVGRNSELKELFVDALGFHGDTKKGIPIAISGLAGIGKTHLALTFAYRFNVFFSDGVYWVDTANGIVQEFEKIGNYLRMERLKDERPLDYATRVYDRLGQLEKGLVVFDNVTDISEFRKWCPVGNRSCSVLLTARKSPRGFAVRVMNLKELDADSAYKLILSRRTDGDKINSDKAQRQALQKICDIMGNHPLALELCACYLQSDFVQPTDFLHGLEKDPLGHLANQPQYQIFLDQGNPNLLDVLARNYNSLKRELIDPYFLLMCWFVPHGINTDLIMKAYDKPLEGARALDELAQNSLIYRETQKTVSLHPLVAQFGRSLAKTQRADYHEKFVEVIIGFLKTNKNSLSSEQVRAELPHVLEALDVSREHGFWDQAAQLGIYCAQMVVGVDTRIELLNGAWQLVEEHLSHEKGKLKDICVQLGIAHKTKEQYKEALANFEKARKLSEESSVVDPGETAALQFELGDIQLALGQYEEARKILTRARDTALNVASYDVTTPNVSRIEQALAKIDLFLGSFDSAEKAFSEVLKHRGQFHTNHPDAESSLAVGSSYADLSQLALERGNYKEAITFAEKALDIIKEYHKENDPACGNLFLLLGTIYHQAGNYASAEEQMGKAQQIFLSIFGDKHPSYARTLVAFGEVHRKLGKFDTAQKEIGEAIEIFENRYSKVHPSIAEALEVQGKIYNHKCEFEKEEETWKRILDIQSKVYSENHPALATTHYDYGNLCLRRGEFDEAVKHLNTSISITEKSLGKTHPEYFGRLIRLATCYFEQQDYLGTQKTLEQAQKLQNSIFGDSRHPYIARMLQLQSEVDRRLGKFDDAQKSIDQAIAMKEAIYGKEHPSVAEALEVKVKVFHHQGETTQAKLLIERALKIRKDHYGPTHPKVGASEHDLGSYYLRLGQYDDAILHFGKAIETTELTFGKFHPEYIERSLHLANALYEKGEHGPSLKLIKDLENVIAKTITSENHYLKARWLFGMAELHRRLGQFEEALKYINKAIEMRIAIYGSKVHPSVAEVLECQGKIYDHLGEFDKEEQVWNRILDIQSKVYPKNHPASATTHYDYGNLCLRRGEFDEAVKHLETSLKITEESLGKNHPEYFGRLIRLATCHYERQNYFQAQETLEDAPSLQESIFGKSPHPYVARMLQLQSEIHRRLGRFDAALTSINRAIEVKERIYGEEHPSVAIALETKARILYHLNDSEEATRLLKHSLEIHEKSYGKNHLAVGRCKAYLGSQYLRVGKYGEAISLFKEALEISKSVFGEKHLEYIETALHLANALNEKGDYRGALRIVEELDGVIKNTISNEKHYLKARWLQDMAELQRRLGQFDKAMDYISQAIEMKEAIYGQVHPSVAAALEIQGKIYDHLFEFDKEEQVWNNILDIQSKVYPKNHPASATTHYDYGNLCLRRGEFDEAINHLNESLIITEKSLGKAHSEYFGRLVLLSACYYEQQRYAQAEEKLKEAQTLQKDIFGESLHSYIGRMHQLQGEVDMQLGRFDAALTSINRAIEVKEKIYGEEHPSVAEALELKVDLYLAQFRVEESKELLERIEQIRKGAYGEQHPKFANFQMQLAEYHSITGSYEEAQKSLEKSLQTCSKKFASGHPEIIKRQVMSARLARISSDIISAENYIAKARQALGIRLQTENSLIVASVLKESAHIKRKQAKYHSSLVELGKAIEIESTTLGTDSPSLVELLVDKAKLLIVSHRLKEAEIVIESTLKSVEGEWPIYKRLKADLLNQRGILETYRGEHDKAIKSFDEALKLKEQVVEKTSAELAKLLVDKAVTLRAGGRYSDALVTLEEAQNINNPLFNENHVYFAKICLENGRTYYCKKSYAAAKEQLEEALKIYRAQPNQDRREHATTLEALGLVYLETGFAPKASQLFGDSLEIKRSIYDRQHPEIAETLYNQALALLKISSANERRGNPQDPARQKLEEALQILKRNDNELKRVQEIENTLSTL